MVTSRFAKKAVAIILLITLSVTELSCSTPAASDTPLPHPAWSRKSETPAQRDVRLQWFRRDRFGMFIHWGLYAIPAGVWKGKDIPGIGEWIMHRANIPVEEYSPLAQQFNPVKFDAAEWVRIAKDAGMKYIVITSKHHDGFSLFDSQLTDYDTVDAAPFKRDVLKELADACQKEGLKFCFYHSIMDWYRPAQKNDFPAYRQFLFGQVRELLTRYGPIGIMWFDGEWIPQWDRAQGRELEKYCHAFQPDVIVNNRVGKRHREDGDYGTPEQFIPSTGIPNHDWEACMTMNDTWGFKQKDHNWKSSRDLVHKLIDIVSKGGNFLLNVGPTAEGEIPAPSVERLAAVGRWMKVNSESIYGTSPSPFRHLPWGRCTRKGRRLYLHVFDWPAHGKLLVPGLINTPGRAYLLADPRRKSLTIRRQDGDLVISIPTQAPDPIASVVVLEVKVPIRVDNTIRPLADGAFEFWGRDAQIHGETIEYHVGHGTSLGDYVHQWSRPDEYLSWPFKVKQPTVYEVHITYACNDGAAGSEFTLEVADQKISAPTVATGSWNKFQTQKIGPLSLQKTGRLTLLLKPKSIAKDALMNFKSLKLIPKP